MLHIESPPCSSPELGRFSWMMGRTEVTERMMQRIMLKEMKNSCRRQSPAWIPVNSLGNNKSVSSTGSSSQTILLELTDFDSYFMSQLSSQVNRLSRFCQHYLCRSGRRRPRCRRWRGRGARCTSAGRRTSSGCRSRRT